MFTQRGSTFVLCTAAVAVLIGRQPTAAAEPPPPPYPPGYVLGAPSVYPGGFSYQWMWNYTNPPAANDTRGVMVGTNADPAMSGVGMPGSRLGDAYPMPNTLTAASARYGISAGLTPPQPGIPGVNVSGGPPQTLLESPSGAPPASPLGVEAIAPSAMPGAPAAMSPLEDPLAGHESGHPVITGR
jgi:hypothetical protein